MEELNPATINLADGTSASKADWIRLRMVSVNGQTGNYILASGHGSQSGYIGEINSIISEELGAILNEMEIEKCADIPTTGTGTAELTDDGDTFTLTATFAAGTKDIPAFYTDGGNTFDKRIVLSEDGDDYLLVELTCGDDTNTVYAFMPETDDNTRAREVYYQRTASTGETRVDVHMTNSSDGEKYITRFHYFNNIAKIWTMRVVGVNASGEAAVIDTTTGVFSAHFHIGTPAGTATFTDASTTKVCIDFNTNNDAGTTCTDNGLTVQNPVDTPEIDNTTYSFVVDSVKTLDLGTIQ